MMKRCAVVSVVVAFVAGVHSSSAFSASDPRQARACRRHASSSSTKLQLVPLSQYNNEVSFLRQNKDIRCSIDQDGTFRNGDDLYELCIVVEDEDIPDLARFVVDAFGADAITLSQDLSAAERIFLDPAAEFLNGYSGFVAFAEVLSGTRQRLESRLQSRSVKAPDLSGLVSRKEMISKVEKDSLILALGRKSSEGNSMNVEIIASIELRLQPCDAKIPFSLPWIDRIERSAASLIGGGGGDTDGADLQPYLSNLCVEESFRGKQLGRALVRCVENIAKETWGYNRMYLHVDEDNDAALNLYKSEGYRDVGHRWSPFWAGSSSAVGYYVKSL